MPAGRADLAGDGLHARQGEVGRVAGLAVVLLELVQVGAQQLAHQEQVLLRRGAQGRALPKAMLTTVRAGSMKQQDQRSGSLL